MQWPDWWEWEIEISSHCLKRMSERGLNETDLRAMLETSTARRGNSLSLLTDFWPEEPSCNKAISK